MFVGKLKSASYLIQEGSDRDDRLRARWHVKNIVEALAGARHGDVRRRTTDASASCDHRLLLIREQALDVVYAVCGSRIPDAPWLTEALLSLI